jgi:hypothetical protein
MSEISAFVVAEVRNYVKARVDGIVFENMHDLPYSLACNQGPEIVSSMTRICVDAVQSLNKTERDQLLLGVQVLAAANKEALAIAHSSGLFFTDKFEFYLELDFIRAESFIFSHIADEGMMNACAGPLLRYRRYIQAEDIAVFADIKKKHS